MRLCCSSCFCPSQGCKCCHHLLSSAQSQHSMTMCMTHLQLCCLLCRVTVNDIMSRAGLGQFFQAFVTAEDGMDTISQRFLSASIKLGRPPNQCVVFESSPAGITAAHNCTMKVWTPRHCCQHLGSCQYLSLLQLQRRVESENGMVLLCTASVASCKAASACVTVCTPHVT